ncbi:hypothetical protein [Klebsiella variicola]|uniref:hypothetical protein n=1 Tax=Klebsiella variicola TaxID=244366 RepID=UPI0028B4B7D8|nr:hypothetical protein [Klebsiella variicola]MDT7005337.1 membrane protein [Klebsiella variicola]MDT7027626.1 membrane protein [Klebsiella variicola]
MADIFYPDEYLPLPLMDGYGFKPISPLLRTEMTSGRAQQRRRYTSTPTQASVKWIFKNDALAQVFEAFFRDALKDGQSWFYLKLQTPIGVKPYKARFVDIYEGPTLVAPKYWQYSATLELWERPLPPSGWGNYPEWLAGQSLLDIALNREWPKHDNS